MSMAKVDAYRKRMEELLKIKNPEYEDALKIFKEYSDILLDIRNLEKFPHFNQYSYFVFLENDSDEYEFVERNRKTIGDFNENYQYIKRVCKEVIDKYNEEKLEKSKKKQTGKILFLD